MKVPLWGLEDGRDWQDSVDDVQTGDARFEANLEALRESLSVFPTKYSRPLVEGVEEDDVRYATTKDVAAGYRLVAFIRLDRDRHKVVLEWLAVEQL